MAAVDCSKTPRSKSIKARALTLRDYEARKLAEDGRALIVREINLRLFSPSDTPGYDWTFRRLGDGCWEDYRTADFLAKHCPLGSVGSPLWGREAHRIIEDPGADPSEVLFTVEREDEFCNVDTLYFVIDYRADGGRRLMDCMGRSEWRSPVAMPRHASRFPRLRHESCEVKRAGELTWDELTATGMPPLPDAIIGAFPGPAEYVEVATVDPSAGPLMPPSGAWAWCSLVVDLDRPEVADA